MDAAAKHRIPVIDRMMEILGRLHEGAGETGIRDLAKQLDVPRTTVYRILNTLQFHCMVVRTSEGQYRLGPRLLTLASRATAEDSYDLNALAVPHLRRLSSETGETSKISIVEGTRLLVLATVPGIRAYALSVTPGEYLPLTVGAAGKMLLAHLPESEQKQILARFSREEGNTETRVRKLTSELVRVKRQGWAEDKGEYTPSVYAFAAPVIGPSGRVAAAVSVPYLGGGTAERSEAIKTAVIATAAEIGAELLAQARPVTAKG